MCFRGEKMCFIIEESCVVKAEHRYVNRKNMWKGKWIFQKRLRKRCECVSVCVGRGVKKRRGYCVYVWER
jgi:hypothetical protein